jgi:Putative citrate transport
MFRPFDVMLSAMLLRRALIRAGFADHRLLTLSMAYVPFRKTGNFSANSQSAREPASQANPCNRRRRGAKSPCSILRSVVQLFPAIAMSSRGAPGTMSACSPARFVLASLSASAMTTATPAMAGEALDGARLPWPLALPFAGMLLSIAFGPLAVKEWWHIHYEKAALFWAILALGGLIAVEGLPAAAAGFVHSMALGYLPFILMLFAFYTAAGGIGVEGRLNGSPPVNTTILAFGAAIANIIGTTGASMILIQPLIRANSARPINAHVVVFFIFLVSTIGGVLTPLGNPPLFLGYLQGIDFFWTVHSLWPPAVFTVAILLVIFFSSIPIFSGAKKVFGRPPRAS